VPIKGPWPGRAEVARPVISEITSGSLGKVPWYFAEFGFAWVNSVAGSRWIETEVGWVMTEARDDSEEGLPFGWASAAPKGPQRELGILVQRSDLKRNGLFQRAKKTEHLHRYLQLGSGVLALLSGLVSGAIFAEILGGGFIKVLTAFAAFMSGLITLFLNTFTNKKENEEMFQGSAQFLSLRDRIRLELAKTGSTDAQLESALKKYIDEYGKLSSKFDRYLKFNEISRP
jgi:hypothetical protein